MGDLEKPYNPRLRYHYSNPYDHFDKIPIKILKVGDKLKYKGNDEEVVGVYDRISLTPDVQEKIGFTSEDFNRHYPMSGSVYIIKYNELFKIANKEGIDEFMRLYPDYKGPPSPLQIISYIKNKSIDFDKDKITKSTYKETETAVGDQDKDIENLEGGKKRKMSKKRKRSRRR